MRIAGNRLSHLRDFFFRELKEKYGEGEIEAMFMLAAEKYLKMDRREIRRKIHEPINQSELLQLYDCAKALKQNLPLQYILGEAWFCGLKLSVDPRVLIPRPETEELVELILKDPSQFSTVLDIGTGSGCIPITIKKNRPAAQVFACDISEEALLLASENAAENGAEIEFVQADILGEDLFPGKQFDLIVSNPPYIKEAEAGDMSAHVLEHEPHLALFVKGEDDIVFYRRIISFCAEHLAPGGGLYFELNPETADKVKDCAEQSGLFSGIELKEDMSGKKRFLKALKK